MNINAKQLSSFDIHKMDVTTALGFFEQVKDLIVPNMALTAVLSGVWQAFVGALADYDDAYAQTRKWAQTDDISKLDTTRDQALSAFLAALKAMTASPNAEKQQAAKLLQFIRDKYSLSTSDEYMKETTAVRQMVQEMESTEANRAALAATGLDDWLTDLKLKNEAFLVKMNERTEAQAEQQKGIVRETRLQVEAAYRDVVKAVNALAIAEVPEGFDYATVINRLNAEIEHYRLILARKGSGSSSGGDKPTPTPTPTPDPDPTPDPTPDPQPDPDPSGGGDGGDDGGGGSEPPSGGDDDVVPEPG